MAPGRAALMLSLLAACAPAGCYKPNITDGGFVCGPQGSCPEDFRCIENRCWRGDAGRSDLGQERMCTVAAPAPLCQAPPAGGQACNPTCQTGCACGRCTVANGAATCLETGGTKSRGEPCNIQADDCAPGLGCVRELCGTTLGRCYEFCTTNADCPDNLSCSITLDGPGGTTGFMVCDIAPQTCNPVGSTGGCPDPALGCYVDSSDRTICDCRGTTPAGDRCDFFSQCVPGYRCVSVGGPPSCQRVCRVGGSDCPLASVCVPPRLGDAYGYCSP